MTAALEHPIGPNTVEDWLTREHPADGARLELIWGYFHVSPAPGGQHQHAGDELREVLKYALRDEGRTDLYAISAVGVKISTAARTALVPDVAVLNTRPVGACFQPDDLVLAVEIWSPGNTRSERETKAAAYAFAQVPYFWTVDQDRIGAITVTAHRLDRGRYVEEATARAGAEVTIKTAPIPVTFDPADLHP